MADPAVLGIIVAGSLLPALAMMLWVRARDKTETEPMMAVLRAFLFGASFGAVTALVLNTLFGAAAAQFTVAGATVFVGAVVAAPFIEEAAKGMGLGTVAREIDEWEDGLVYGAAIGLGFAATENMIYGINTYLSDDAYLAGTVVAMRVFSSMILHAVTTALLGFGFAAVRLRAGVWPQIIPFFLMAAAIHAAYNFLVLWNSIVGFVSALAMVWAIWWTMARRIRQLDALPHQYTSE